MDVKCCPTCWQIIPISKVDEQTIPIDSIYHVICKGCGWPIAKSLLGEHEVCGMCRKSIKDQQSKLKVV